MKNLKYFLIIAFAAVTAFFSYYIKSTDTYFIIGCYASLFLIYFLLLKNLTDEDVQWALYAAFGLRLLVVPSTLFLSNDIWRYLWDGNMQAIGYSPYTIAPKEVMDAGFNTFKGAGNLFHQLLSGRENSVYAPFAEIIFYISIKISLGNQYIAIMLIKFILVIAEIVSISALLQLLQKFSLPIKNIFVYAFNPLIIIQVIADAHLEALMICFLLVALLCFKENKYKRAIFFYVLSVATKLFPIIFLPIFLFRNNWKQNLKLLISLTFLTGILFVIYFYGINVRYTYLSSLQLYFNQFEHNSFLFYWINIVFPNSFQPTAAAILSRILFAMPCLIMIYWSWASRTLSIEKLLIKILLFWVLSTLTFTVINPWYIAPLVLLAVFAESYMIILWSALAIVSALITQHIPNDLISHSINLIWYSLLVFVFFWKDSKFLKS